MGHSAGRRVSLGFRGGNRGGAAIATTVLLIVVIFYLGNLPVAGPSNNYEGARSSGLQAFDWSSSLANAEANWCLRLAGPNSTLDFSSVGVNETLVNLTASTSGACSKWPQHWGIGAVTFNGSTAEEVLLENTNNTTSGKSPSVFTYVTSYRSLQNPSYGPGIPALTFYLNYTPSSRDLGFMPTCDGCGGGGGGGGGGGDGGTIVPLATFSGPSVPCPTQPGGQFSPTIYWWDSVCFTKGFGILYPHPYLPAYGATAAEDVQIDGNLLFHSQLGTTLLAGVSGLGTTVVAALIGALIGVAIGSPGGPVVAIAAAIIGAVIAAVAVTVTRLTLQDESGAIWFWLNNGFITAAGNIPWWAWALGPQACIAYVSGHLHDFRLGNTWLMNNGISGP